jgi:hypothetical protein
MGEVTKWEQIKIHRDHLQRLPSLVAQGRFFLVFVDYFNSAWFWGLSMDISSEEYRDHLNIDPDKRVALVHDWKVTGGELPEPLIGSDTGTTISGEFLYRGNYLFSPPNDRNPGLDDDRRRFDEAAKHGLKRLLSIIIALPRLPLTTKELLQTYSQRLLINAPLGE